MKYKISVILPVYRSEKYILNCLKSIIGQTYLPYEIILVSDGCVDNSIIIAREFLAKSSIKFEIIEQENQGVSSARNNGISRATGDWIIAIDSDDCIYPHTFELLMSNVLDEDVLAIGYATNQPIEVEPVVTSEDIISIDGVDAINKFFERKYKFVAPALMIKRTFLKKNKIEYDVGCLFAEDDIYVWKVLCMVGKILYINKPLYNYIFHSNSTMTSTNINKFYSVKQFSVDLNCNYIQKSQNADGIKDIILYRHYFGLIHAAAKIQNYKDFRNLIQFYDMKNLYRNCYKFFRIKERILFGMPLFFPILSYCLLRIK